MTDILQATILRCTVCHCPTSECLHPGQHMDWYMTPEQLVHDEAISAAESKWEENRQ